MDKLSMKSVDATKLNIERIAALFPQCVTETIRDGKTEKVIDFEKLRAELGDKAVDDTEERYQFTWPDKHKTSRLANLPTTMTLRPCRAESVDFDNTKNLYIEGDNLEVLKILRETYLGKVKMIYIDPPYNTGKDFIYNDDFSQSKEDFEERNGFFDEDGNQTQDPMIRNTESNGRFHTDWLNMIYPRLKLARVFLSEDGLIFISIDDNELENLKKICNEIFGEKNFQATVIPISNPGGRDYKQIAVTNEFLLIYSKSDQAILKELPSEKEFQFKDERGGGMMYEILEIEIRNSIEVTDQIYSMHSM